LSFRMRAAGYRGPDVFTQRAVGFIARASDGLTRRINILADKALLSAFTENGHAVTHRHVRAAVRDSEFAKVGQPPLRPAAYAAAAALAAGVAIGLAVRPGWMAKPEPPVQPVQAAPIVFAALPVALPEPQSNLNAEQARRLERYSPAGQRLLADRIAATRKVLQRAPDEGYSIELFVTENSDPARMERFLARARDLVPLEELFVIPMAGGGNYRLRVVYGEFASRDEAAA